METYQEFIMFLGTDNLKETDEFYRGKLGLELYKDQGACMIYKINENLRLVFALI